MNWQQLVDFCGFSRSIMKYNYVQRTNDRGLKFGRLLPNFAAKVVYLDIISFTLNEKTLVLDTDLQFLFLRASERSRKLFVTG